MTTANENATDLQARPLVVSRTFLVPRAWVFKAWTSAEHIRRWFCPAGFSVPQAEIDFRVGGVFNVCMRSPEGQDYWTRGHYTEIVPDARLVIEMSAVDDQGKPLFHAHTVATFTDAQGGTRLEVTQRYTVLVPSVAEAMLRGAPQGWEQTLDRLAREAARMPESVPAERSAVHASFTIERTYLAPRERVFQALTDPAAKARWFAGGNGYTVLVREMDVRPGGRELVKGRWESGVVSTFEAVYHDVVPDERIVYAYTMHLDARKISVSLATIELKPSGTGTGTRLVMTEQGAYLDGYDDAGSRERGTQFLLDALGRSLDG